MIKKLFLYTLAASFILTASSANAETVSGTFTAVSDCDAYKSFTQGINPGLIKVIPGEKYDAVEVNNKEMDWVRVRVPDIADPLRWVSGQCGTKEFAPTEAAHTLAAAGKTCNKANQYDSYVLAMTWQPGFCKHVHYNGVKPECDALKDGSLVIDHLTIHGLWPNRKECGTNYGNCGGPDLCLEDSTISELGPWMPNFLYEQTFGSYEWKKHGTCQERQDDDYFLTELKLVQAIDASEAGAYIKSKIGAKMSAKEFFQKLSNAYGQDVADRFMLACVAGNYLQEIRVNLPKQLTPDADLSKMTQGGKKMNARTDKCSDDLIYVEKSGEEAICETAVKGAGAP